MSIRPYTKNIFHFYKSDGVRKMKAMDCEREAAMFKALSEPARLRILALLGNGELCACMLLEHLCISQPTLSHHMKVLTECGLVRGRKEATWMHYSIDTERVGDLRRYLDTLTHNTKNTTMVQC